MNTHLKKKNRSVLLSFLYFFDMCFCLVCNFDEEVVVFFLVGHCIFLYNDCQRLLPSVFRVLGANQERPSRRADRYIICN